MASIIAIWVCFLVHRRRIEINMDKLDQKIAALRRRVVAFCNAIATTSTTTAAE